MLLEICGILGPLVIGENHNDHVATLFEWLRFIRAVWIPLGQRESAKIMNGICVGVVAVLLVQEQRLQEVIEKFRVRVQDEGYRRENDVHGLNITVGTNFLQENQRVCVSSREL